MTDGGFAASARPIGDDHALAQAGRDAAYLDAYADRLTEKWGADAARTVAPIIRGLADSFRAGLTLPDGDDDGTATNHQS